MDEETIMTQARYLIDMRNPTRVDDLTQMLARLTDPEKDFSEYPTYHDCVLEIKQLLNIDANTDASSTPTLTSSTSSGDVNNTDTDDASPRDENSTLVSFPPNSSEGGGGTYTLPSDFPLPHTDDATQDESGADNDYTLMVPSEELDDEDSYPDADDFSRPVDEDDPYAMTPVDEDDIDTSVMPLDEMITSTSSGPKSPLSGSAPTVDTQSADDSMKSFALFDTHLPKERREFLLSALKQWFEQQITPMHLSLPPCLLQHQGPLVYTYALFGDFIYANLVAKTTSRGYGPYVFALTQYLSQTVSPHGIWYPELTACLTAGEHVTPEEPSPIHEVVALDPFKVTF
jgi:hypothetical protein